MPIKFSVIIPAYNVEKYLVRCVDSVLEQNRSDFEVIIVNDGSTDYTLQICKALKQKDDRVIIIDKENEGVSVARNAGIKIAKGEYITFIDADDWVSKDYLATIDEAMYDTDLLFFGNFQVRDDGSMQAFSPGDRNATNKLDTEAVLYRMMLNDCNYEFFGFTWNKCFKASIIRENNITFMPGLSLREDELFTDTYSRHIASVKTINAVIYYYRFSYTGLTYRFHPGAEVLMLAKGLDSVSNGIDFQPLLFNRKVKVFHYMFTATTNMHTNESLRIFEYLYDYYQMYGDIIGTRIRRYRRIFSKQRVLARIHFLIKRRLLKRRYKAV